MFKATTYIAALATALLGTVAGSATAQAVHTIVAAYHSHPIGPNSDFSVDLKLEPADVDIVGFEIAVGYDNTQVSFLGVTDNTGQPQAEAQYDPHENDIAFNGVSYVNVVRPISMHTEMELITPEDLGRINFRTTASYNVSDPIGIYITGYSGTAGINDSAGGLVNAVFQAIPTAYDSLEPTSSVSEWMFY